MTWAKNLCRRMVPSAARALALVALALAAIAVQASPAGAAQPFGVETFANEIVNSEGASVTQAGAHPYAMTTTIEFDHHEIEEEKQAPDGDPKTLEVGLPQGMIINPAATPTRCTEAELEEKGNCPNTSAVGIAEIDSAALGKELLVPVFNIVPPPGAPAELGFNAAGSGLIVHIVGKVRTGADYGISGEVSNITQKFGVYETKLTLWGDPGAIAHNLQRGRCIYQLESSAEEIAEGREVEIEPGVYSCPQKDSGVPLLTMPDICTGQPLQATLRADSWQEPALIEAPAAESPAVTGCGRTNFTPDVKVKPQPEVAVADSPTGLGFDLKIPQEESLNGLAEAQLKDVTVMLPTGVTVSPSSATGLGACSPEQIALRAASPQTCPDASRIGNVEIITPLLEHPLTGAVFLAQQNNNPFGSLLAIYLVAEGSGVVIKLAGHVEADQTTGQLTARFSENPPLPFNDLKVNFYGGPRAPLMTPFSCGSYATNTELTPWSGLSATSLLDTFAVSSGCGDAFAPAFTAGTTSAQAGAFAPFTLTLSRQDGEQRFGSVHVQLPPGLLGAIKSVPRCPEPQAARGTCSGESEIGQTTVAAGPGSNPFQVGGKVYLTGPYEGAPFGLSVVVPAIAGPFNLGNIVVRATITVDPVTAQVTATSDALPQMINSIEGLKSGIPTDIRAITLSIDRPGFIFNPTNCEPLKVAGAITSPDAAIAIVTSPFHTANCATLPFKPVLSASTAGSASKANGASFDVKVSYPTGPIGSYANVKSVKVDLPKQLPSRLTTLQKACLAATFEANPANCPSASDVGMATASTPVLNVPLTGPAYLVSHGGEAFPDLEIVLQGEGVTLILDGNTQIKKGITSSTFKAVPDAPVSGFELKLPTGKFSILGANVPQSAKYSLCGQTLSMPTEITGQNGAVVKQSTQIGVSGCAKKKTLTRSQKLTAAIKACHNKPKPNRAGCEKTAQKRYGPTKRRNS